jgi:probable HAF family extracellular repeat protein
MVPMRFYGMLRGEYKTIGVLPGGSSSSATGINAFGTVVGSSGSAQNPAGAFAFLWSRKGGMKNLGTLPGGAWSSASGVNDLGQVVGIADAPSSPTHAFHRGRNGAPTSDASLAFTWSADKGMLDLNDLIPGGSGWVLINATAINLFGQIAGWGTINGETHGFLLMPSY